MSRRARGKTRTEPVTPTIEPGERCKSGAHLRTTANTGVANTGRRFCRTCKYERAAARGDVHTKRPRAQAVESVLSVFEIERTLAQLPCMCCGALPTRRGVGKDGTPRWLDAPVTAHGAGCTVGARREIVQRNRGKGKGVAA